MDCVILSVGGMTIESLVAIARHGARVALAPEARENIVKAGALVEKWVEEGKAVYGVTTGFGALSDVRIGKKDTRLLQKNILMSHAAGVGNLLEPEIVRGVMALRIKDMARGNSGVRLSTVQMLVELLNRAVVPAIPEKGSVGASGDLAPMAHMALVLVGMGKAFYKGKKISGKRALQTSGLKPLTLESVEGLALINGTQVMTAIGALAVHDTERLCKTIDIAAAMSLEVLMGSRTEFDERTHRARPHPGQALAARNMEKMTRDSEIISSHKDCARIQDAYTLRCSPQVHGASRDAAGYVRKVIETEMNSSTNNPLIFPETEDLLLGGNFHGQPVALAMDFLCMAVAELASISERRVERLVNPKLSGLPAFLVENGGLNSGFMIAQYTAASLVSENKVLCHPACVDSIPTSANKEDHVPMGTISARKCREIVKNAEHVVAIELLCAAQALDLFTNLQPGTGTLAAYRCVREKIAHLSRDRVLSEDIEKMVQLLRSGQIIHAVEEKTGPLD